MARPKKYTEKWLKRMAIKMLQYARDTALPLKEDFASKNKFAAQRISEFEKSSTVFSEALKRFENICLYKWATTKEVEPAMRIFTLKNIAHWKDSTEVKVGGKIEGMQTNLSILIGNLTEDKLLDYFNARTRTSVGQPIQQGNN